MKKALIGVIFLCACGGSAAADPWTPDMQTIAKLESVIRIPAWGRSTMYPQGHIPVVTEYERYYTGELSDGHRRIFGELLARGQHGQTVIHLVASSKAFPVIMDGGCGIVNLVYDVDTARIVSLQCNGLA